MILGTAILAGSARPLWWAILNGAEMDFSRPGKPTDNAKIEAFNAWLRAKCLNESRVLSLEDSREKIEGGAGTTTANVPTAPWTTSPRGALTWWPQQGFNDPHD